MDGVLIVLKSDGSAKFGRRQTTWLLGIQSESPIPLSVRF